MQKNRKFFSLIPKMKEKFSKNKCETEYSEKPHKGANVIDKHIRVNKAKEILNSYNKHNVNEYEYVLKNNYGKRIKQEKKLKEIKFSEIKVKTREKTREEKRREYINKKKYNFQYNWVDIIGDLTNEKNPIQGSMIYSMFREYVSSMEKIIGIEPPIYEISEPTLEKLYSGNYSIIIRF